MKVWVFPVDEEEDEEEVYKMAGVMAQCGGLECMLNRLSGIKDFKQGRHLLTVSIQSKCKKMCVFVLNMKIVSYVEFCFVQNGSLM